MRGEVYHIDQAVDIVQGGPGTLRFLLPGGEFTLRDPAGIARKVSSRFQSGAKIDDVLAGFDGDDARRAAAQVIDVFKSRRVLKSAPKSKAVAYDALRNWICHYAAVPEQKARTVRLVGHGVLAGILRPRLAASGIDCDGSLTKGACLIAVSDTPNLPLLRQQNADACERGHAFLPAWLERSVVHWGPALMPGATGCLECLLHRRQAARARAEPILDAACDGLGVSATLAAIGGGFVMAEVLRWAFDAHVDTDLGMAWSFDLLTMNLSGSKVLRLPRCPACGRAQGDVS